MSAHPTLAPSPPPAAHRVDDVRSTPGQEGEQGEILAFSSEVFPERRRYVVESAVARGGAAEDVLLLKDRAGRIHGFLSTWTYRSATLAPACTGTRRWASDSEILGHSASPSACADRDWAWRWCQRA